jgi:hypothetical protein
MIMIIIIIMIMVMIIIIIIIIILFFFSSFTAHVFMSTAVPSLAYPVAWCCVQSSV